MEVAPGRFEYDFDPDTVEPLVDSMLAQVLDAYFDHEEGYAGMSLADYLDSVGYVGAPPCPGPSCPVTFANLLAHVGAAEIEVLRHWRELEEDGRAGDYKSREDGAFPQPAIIRIFHAGGSSVIAEPEDTFTLAHEYGHHLSCDRGNHTPEYRGALELIWQEWKTLPERVRQAVFDEEARAWDNGEGVLGHLGSFDTSAFDKQRDASLALYRERLVLPASG